MMMSDNWLSRKVAKLKNMWTSHSNHLYFIFKFLPFIAIYINGLYGMGLVSLVICLIFGVASFYFHDKREIIVKGNNSAAWFQDANLERVEWINKILRDLWPHIEKLLENMSSEFLLDGMLHQFVQSFMDLCLDKMIRFGVKKVEVKRIALGKVFPRISGIKVSQTKNLEMIIDLNLHYTGDARFDFEMETVLGGKLPFYLRNVSFAGEVQINMGSLCDKFPIITGIKVKRLGLNYRSSYIFRLFTGVSAVSPQPRL